MKAVMYGAGSIGRGFIGALFSEIGYEVVFIDVNDDVIHLINKEKTYPQIIMNEEQPVHWIKNIRASQRLCCLRDRLYYAVRPLSSNFLPDDNFFSTLNEMHIAKFIRF